jgi:hypothetical protein
MPITEFLRHRSRLFVYRSVIRMPLVPSLSSFPSVKSEMVACESLTPGNRRKRRILLSTMRTVTAVLNMRQVRGPGLQDGVLVPGSCMPRAPTRRSGSTRKRLLARLSPLVKRAIIPPKPHPTIPRAAPESRRSTSSPGLEVLRRDSCGATEARLGGGRRYFPHYS